MNSIFLFCGVVMLLSCSRNATPPVPERNYYLEVRTFQNDTFNKEVVDFLEHKIPQQKYTITKQSGLSWPYYASLELNETISVDSLMPPHWYLHRMILKGPNTTLKKDDYLVRIDVMPTPDTLLNYQVEIYEMDSVRLELSATTGIHFVDSADFSSRSHLLDYYLKSIIRYSFK